MLGFGFWGLIIFGLGPLLFGPGGIAPPTWTLRTPKFGGGVAGVVIHSLSGCCLSHAIAREGKLLSVLAIALKLPRAVLPVRGAT